MTILRRYKKWLLSIFIILFVLINAIAYFHAYKFTHFDIEETTRTNDPNKLSIVQKIRTIVFGIDNPRPTNTSFPNRKFKTIKIKYNSDTIDCWHIIIDSLQPTVLIFHGYAGCKSQMIEKSNLLNDLGFNTVLVDFIGSGNSTGNKTTIGYFESEQVKYVFDYFNKYTAKSKIILYGISMGSVAIMKSISDYNLEPTSIIIECPFGNMLKTVQARFKIMNAPSFPMSYLLLFYGGLQNNFNAFNHNPTEYAKKIKIKTLLMYGLKDNKVSKEEIDLIFKNLQGEKQLKIYKSAGHEDIVDKYKEEWKENIIKFTK
ncbi:MAG: alpha/beta fold hydrolase [Sphingobacteriales bacterium]|nr:MAG: alpha/beta fold hydrolase [Sphingobacteriales bacterium]